MVVRPRPGQLLREAPVHERHVRQRARRTVGVERVERAADRHVLGAPQAQERQVAVVVPADEPPSGQPVPDRRQLRDRGAVFNPVGLAGVLVDAIGERRPEDGAEVPVERPPVEHRAAEEGKVFLAVVADGEDVVGAQPPVTRAAVVLHPSPGIGVIGIAVTAALKVRGQRKSRMGNAGGVDVREPRLLAVGAREPAEEMVERPVLHHEHDDVLDAAGRGVRQHVAAELRARRRDDGSIAASQRDAAHCGGSGGQEPAARDE